MAKLGNVFAVIAFALIGSDAYARSPQTDARAGIQAFVANCFSPFLTGDKARDVFNYANIRYEFYDLTPFSNVDPSPVMGRPATPGTDRRCEVAFNGDYSMEASTAVFAQLRAEGITAPAEVPDTYQPTEGTMLLAARQLNPRRVAVVHVGTRARGSETETFMFVERLLPQGE
ncbi:MAG: succinyl-CoA synthetase subunit beta [Silicimonas sp.]|nr:succinyl-CoA synthetase subunit beta [Silicimonas sp.]